jgi:hypothetical protein
MKWTKNTSEPHEGLRRSWRKQEGENEGIENGRSEENSG